MENIEKSNISIKSNVNLKDRGVVHPMDNIPKIYLDVRYRSVLTEVQKRDIERMLFYSEDVFDENNNKVEIKCFKGCENCGHEYNDCKHPQNKAR